MLATSRFKRGSDPTSGSKNINILLLGEGPAAGVLIVVMFCVRRIKKIEKREKNWLTPQNLLLIVSKLLIITGTKETICFGEKH